MPSNDDTCQRCHRSAEAMDREDWECSQVECPTRPVCWAGTRTVSRRAALPLPNPIRELLDPLEA